MEGLTACKQTDRQTASQPASQTDGRTDRGRTDGRTWHNVLSVVPAVIALDGGPDGVESGQHTTAAGLDDVDPLGFVAVLAQHHATSATHGPPGLSIRSFARRRKTCRIHEEFDSGRTSGRNEMQLKET